MDQMTQWLDANTMTCERFEARITAAACRSYAKANPARCEDCDRAGGRRRKRCTVDGCRREYYAKGMCKSHYQQASLARKKERERARQ